ncbi:unnamed protein product [Merluccius merluccius]
MDRAEHQDEALAMRDNLERRLGESLPCLADSDKHPDDAILQRRYTLRLALFALQWPSLMLGGGALLVALVRLSQWVELARQDPQRRSFEEDRKSPSHIQMRLYDFRRPSMQDCEATT